MALTDADLGSAMNVPCMINAEEMRFYHWVAREMAQVNGAVVELGSFIGGSTAHLAEGTRQGGNRTKVHFAYDHFGATEKLKQRQLYTKGIAPFDGEDILPLAQDLLAPWQHNITLCKGRIEDSLWQGGPISILIMDASKTARATDKMASLFMPHLIPGKSLLIQQDELHWKEPWVAAQMQGMAEYFAPLCHIPGTSVTYLCTKSPDRRAMRKGKTSRLTDEELQDALMRTKKRLSALNVAALVDRQIKGLRLNPNARKSWLFKKRPPR